MATMACATCASPRTIPRRPERPLGQHGGPQLERRRAHAVAAASGPGRPAGVYWQGARQFEPPRGRGRTARARPGGRGITVQSLDVDVDVDAADSRESRVDVRATVIHLGPVELDAARFGAHGRFAEHELALEFSSPGGGTQRLPGFEGRVGARGGTRMHTALRGSLGQASFEFPDGGAVAAATGRDRGEPHGAARGSRLPADRRRATLCRGRASVAARVLEPDLQRPGLAAQATAALDPGLEGV